MLNMKHKNSRFHEQLKNRGKKQIDSYAMSLTKETKPLPKKASCTGLHAAEQSFGVSAPSHPLTSPLPLTCNFLLFLKILLTTIQKGLLPYNRASYRWNWPSNWSHYVMYVVHKKQLCQCWIFVLLGFPIQVILESLHNPCSYWC